MKSEGKVTVSVEWGYELHSIEIGPRKWMRISNGEEVTIDSVGYYEGEEFSVSWCFNTDPQDTLIVTYGDDGGMGFVGKIDEAITSR
jgi:hypothetical protein